MQSAKLTLPSPVGMGSSQVVMQLRAVNSARKDSFFADIKILLFAKLGAKGSGR